MLFNRPGRARPLNPHIIGGLAIVLIAIILAITGAKIPAHTSVIRNTNTMTNQTSNYAGTLPDDEVNVSIRLTTNRGPITIQVDPKLAPIAASNFVTLVKDGFYDGIKWHRVEPGFVVQAGDPQTKNPDVDPSLWGTGGPGYAIPDEPVKGEYTTGAVAMARTAQPNSAGSQFFIMLADTPTLPKDYVIFGHVAEGQDIVQQIEVGDVIESAQVVE